MRGETVCICLKQAEFNTVRGQTVCICLKQGEFNSNMHKQFDRVRSETICICLKQWSSTSICINSFTTYAVKLFVFIWNNVNVIIRYYLAIAYHTLRVLWVYEETRLLPWISTTFSVALTLNFAFLPRKLMVSHGQGFCSLCPAFVVFCQHFCSRCYKVLLTVWTV